MCQGSAPGSGRILDFSKAVTGCLFFVPSADFLEDPTGEAGSSRTVAAHRDSSPLRP